ncbi:PKS-like enzyme [Penicillium angulare]|uniref:PKS-like enzyme n=1 Tax=Penicillium angulare TaxID=116970 RepID=UPI00254257BC|nr:PKS-like enzyme [Penicillium angulare]KAJ5280860.1 PKS-like enzyme [Penicillium angulare]
MTSFPTSLAEALDLPIPNEKQCSVNLSTDIAFGGVSSGGYIACVMAKYATLYASKHPKLNKQSDIRSSTVMFYRPVVPTKSAVMVLREVSIGKAWSTLRVEISQGEKIAASSDITITSFSVPGITLQTGWNLFPPPRQVDLLKLEKGEDPAWTSYQTAFYPDGFRRGHSYIRNFIPKTWSADNSFVEQWVLPGWDCEPLGSCAKPENEKALWTNDMVQFIVDNGLPVQENYMPLVPGKSLPMGSVAATLAFAAAQEKARNEGNPQWRALRDDGSKKIMVQTVHVTLSMSTEIKKNLPREGVRWLYLRTEAKHIENGRMDLEILLYDEKMELVAVNNQVAQIIPAMGKSKKGDDSRL